MKGHHGDKRKTAILTLIPTWNLVSDANVLHSVSVPPPPKKNNCQLGRGYSLSISEELNFILFICTSNSHCTKSSHY